LHLREIAVRNSLSHARASAFDASITGFGTYALRRKYLRQLAPAKLECISCTQVPQITPSFFARRNHNPPQRSQYFSSTTTLI
jgi:hypothetical protein